MMVKHETVYSDSMILSERYVSSLLLFLFKNEDVHTVDLKSISSYYQGIVKRAEELSDMGLIDIEEQSKPFHKRTFRLTPDGKKIAEKLNEAESILKEILEENQALFK